MADAFFNFTQMKSYFADYDMSMVPGHIHLLPKNRIVKVGDFSYRSIAEAVLLHHGMILRDKDGESERLLSFLGTDRINDIFLTPLNLSSYYEAIDFLFQIKMNNINFNRLRILDIGTFIGLFVAFMHDLGFQNTYGIDCSEVTVEVAKHLAIKNVSAISFEEMNSSFADGSFDIVVSMGVLDIIDESSPSEDVFFDNCSHILSRNGLLIFKPKLYSMKCAPRIHALLEKHGFHDVFVLHDAIFFALKK